MNTSTLKTALLAALAVSVMQCGAEDPGALTTEAEMTQSALRSSVPETNRTVRLECGGWYIEVTRATASSGSQSRAREKCEDEVREKRPARVRCEECDEEGACRPLLRRSDIITNCEWDRDDEIWRCSCGQRTVLGCSPCWDLDSAGDNASPARCAAKK